MRLEIKSVPLEVEIITSEEGVCISTTDKSYDIIGFHIVVQENTLEAATEHFWKSAKIASSYHQKRSKELNKWKPFQKGEWKSTAGSWFIVYGFKFYFRYGADMKGGWYIPLTKMNITITNLWNK